MRKSLAVVALGVFVEGASFGMSSGNCFNYTCGLMDNGRTMCNISMMENVHKFSCDLLDGLVARCCSVAEPSKVLSKVCDFIEWGGFGTTVLSLGRSVLKYFDPTPAWKVFTRGKFQQVLSNDWLGFISTLPSIGCFVASCFVDVGAYEIIICNSIPIATAIMQTLLDGKKIISRCCGSKNYERDRVKEFLSKAMDNKELVTMEMITDVENCLNVLEKVYNYDVREARRDLSNLKRAVRSQF